jgi:hypothetical protein
VRASWPSYSQGIAEFKVGGANDGRVLAIAMRAAGFKANLGQYGESGARDRAILVVPSRASCAPQDSTRRVMNAGSFVENSSG